jgi:hypothetical protein
MMWAVAKRERERNISAVLLFRMKALTEFAFAPPRSVHADFLQYLSGVTKREYNSQRADSVHVTEHRLFVAGFSLQMPGFAPRAVQMSTNSIVTIKRDRSLIYKK